MAKAPIQLAGSTIGQGAGNLPEQRISVNPQDFQFSSRSAANSINASLNRMGASLQNVAQTIQRSEQVEAQKDRALWMSQAQTDAKIYWDAKLESGDIKSDPKQFTQQFREWQDQYLQGADEETKRQFMMRTEGMRASIISSHQRRVKSAEAQETTQTVRANLMETLQSMREGPEGIKNAEELNQTLKEIDPASAEKSANMIGISKFQQTGEEKDIDNTSLPSGTKQAIKSSVNQYRDISIQGAKKSTNAQLETVSANISDGQITPLSSVEVASIIYESGLAYGGKDAEAVQAWAKNGFKGDLKGASETFYTNINKLVSANEARDHADNLIAINRNTPEALRMMADPAITPASKIFPEDAGIAEATRGHIKKLVKQIDTDPMGIRMPGDIYVDQLQQSVSDMEQQYLETRRNGDPESLKQAEQHLVQATKDLTSYKREVAKMLQPDDDKIPPMSVKEARGLANGLNSIFQSGVTNDTKPILDMTLAKMRGARESGISIAAQLDQMGEYGLDNSIQFLLSGVSDADGIKEADIALVKAATLPETEIRKKLPEEVLQEFDKYKTEKGWNGVMLKESVLDKHNEMFNTEKTMRDLKMFAVDFASVTGNTPKDIERDIVPLVFNMGMKLYATGDYSSPKEAIEASKNMIVKSKYRFENTGGTGRSLVDMSYVKSLPGEEEDNLKQIKKGLKRELGFSLGDTKEALRAGGMGISEMVEQELAGMSDEDFIVEREKFMATGPAVPIGRTTQRVNLKEDTRKTRIKQEADRVFAQIKETAKWVQVGDKFKLVFSGGGDELFPVKNSDGKNIVKTIDEILEQRSLPPTVDTLHPLMAP